MRVHCNAVDLQRDWFLFIFKTSVFAFSDARNTMVWTQKKTKALISKCQSKICDIIHLFFKLIFLKQLLKPAKRIHFFGYCIVLCFIVT